MRTYLQHSNIIKDALGATNSDKTAQIERTTNVCLQTICGLFPVGMLCTSMEVTAGDDAWLPDNIAGITAVYDSDGNIVWERGEGASAADEEIYRYYEENVYASPASDALPFLSAGSISAGGSELTASDSAEDAGVVAGMTVRIVNATHGEYYYKISSVSGTLITIAGAHPYAEIGVEVSVLREMSRRIRFVDDSEDAVTSGTFTIYYWTYPNPLSKDTDIIPLAYPDALELMTIRRMPETKSRRPVAKGELDDAISLAQVREPDQSLPARPSGQQGKPLIASRPNSDAYSVRGG